MTRGVPSTLDDARQSLRERIKEMQQRLKHYDQREKMCAELKKWMAHRKLDANDLWWMWRQIKPTRPQGQPVKSKKPLQPPKAANGGFVEKGKLMNSKGDPEFRRRLREARQSKKLTCEALGGKIGLSGSGISSYENGRYVPSEAIRLKLVKVLGLPEGLGKAASLEMEVTRTGGVPAAAKAPGQ